MRIKESVKHGNVQMNVRSFNTKILHFSRMLVLRQATRYKDVAQEGCPKKTGEMKESIGNPNHKYGVWEVSPKGLSIHVGSSHPAILIVENGARPHPIDAKNHDFLKFKHSKTGKWVFIEHVKHLGFKGKFFMRKAAFETKRIRL